MFNQFVLQPSYKIKASNHATWPGNPFFTMEKIELPSPLGPNPGMIYTHIPWGVKQINALICLWIQKSAVSMCMFLNTGSASTVSTPKMCCHHRHEIHKRAICDSCLEAEKGSVFCQVTTLLPSATFDPPGPTAVSSHYTAVLSESMPSRESISMQQ